MKITGNGIEIHYDQAGSGPFVTFCHSLATDHTIWSSQAKTLQDRYSVLTYDLRGHGRTSASSGAYTLELLADDVLALWDALRIDASHVVGISLGGMIAQTLALRARKRVASLVLADTSSFYPPDAASNFNERAHLVSEQGVGVMVDSTLERWFTTAYRAARPEVLERIGNLIRGTSVAGYAGCCQAISKLNTFEHLDEIRCPALVIVGEEDQGTPPEMARALAGGIKGARLEIIPGAHLTCIEQADHFNRLLSDFLSAHA